MEKQKKQAGSDWKNVAAGFGSMMFKRISDNISSEMHKKFLKLKKQIAGSFLIFVGAIFLLIALALFINTLTIPWLGYLIVALVVMAAGYLLTKE